MKLEKVLKLAAVAGVLGGAPVAAHEASRVPGPPAAENSLAGTESTPSMTQKVFKVDGLIAADVGTATERRDLAEQLFSLVKKEGTTGRRKDTLEKLFAFTLAGEKVRALVIIFPDSNSLQITVPYESRVPIGLMDRGCTGTPSEHQLPIEEKGIVRYERYITPGQDPAATRIYLGVLRQLLSTL